MSPALVYDKCAREHLVHRNNSSIRYRQTQQHQFDLNNRREGNESIYEYSRREVGSGCNEPVEGKAGRGIASEWDELLKSFHGA